MMEGGKAEVGTLAGFFPKLQGWKQCSGYFIWWSKLSLAPVTTEPNWGQWEMQKDKR
jgi:hypothetical protein